MPRKESEIGHDRAERWPRVDVLRATVVVIPIMWEMMQLQFTYSARREIGERDSWTCVNCGRSFRNGWMVQAAHFPDDHSPGQQDPNPANGRILCTGCHIIEHLQMDDYRSARLLWESMTVRTYDWIDAHGGQDEKPAFDHYEVAAGVKVPFEG